MGFLYRVGQFWQNMTAGPLAESAAQEISEVLNDREWRIFRQMSVSDQWHAYRVFRLLQETGQTNADLLAAALLHDVGKGCVRLSVWDRSLGVLGEAVVPIKAGQWGDGHAAGWQRPFVVRKQHAAWGAGLAASAGSRPIVVDLIAHHQDRFPSGDEMVDEFLALLQWADDQN